MQDGQVEIDDAVHKTPTSSKTAKAITGCGGCGCLTGLLSVIAGGGLMAWGAIDSKVDELIAPGAGVMVLAVFIGVFRTGFLIGGIIAMVRSKRRVDELQDELPSSSDGAPGVTPGSVSAQQPPPDAGASSGGGAVPPPGTPPPGPPPEW